tara:strand:+ start:272 stop:526 length:255 start_codon:yes stop_codon:yes gene_type:complete
MNLIDFKEDYDDHERAEKIKRYASEKEAYKKHKVEKKYGKKSKTYKDFVAGKGIKSTTRTQKGVRAVHQGRWGYMKDRKFTPDK